MGIKRIPTRATQWPLTAEFVIDFDDTMKDVNGANTTFSDVATKVLEVIPLPPGAVVLYGAVTTEIGYTGGTVSVTVGDSGNATRYLGATDRTAAGRTALVPTGYVGNGENIRAAVTVAGGALTAGRLSLHLTYIVRGRQNEVQIT